MDTGNTTIVIISRHNEIFKVKHNTINESINQMKV